MSNANFLRLEIDFRLINEFNAFNEFIIFLVFLWTLLSLSSILLEFLIAIVEYTHTDFADCDFAQFIERSELKSLSCFLSVLFEKKDSLDLPIQLVLSVLVLFSFAIIFACCELGAQLTNQFSTLNEELYRFEWYSLPVGVQRMVLIFMSGTQQPVCLRGYGNIVCTREALKNVCISRAICDFVKFDVLLIFLFNFRRFMLDFLIS